MCRAGDLGLLGERAHLRRYQPPGRMTFPATPCGTEPPSRILRRL